MAYLHQDKVTSLQRILARRKARKQPAAPSVPMPTLMDNLARQYYASASRQQH